MTADRDVRFAILGAGISGLSTSFHLHHRDAFIFEAGGHYGGHIRSETRDGFTWDDGPHISFTGNSYVKELLAWCVEGKYETVRTRVSNYFRGHWIDHPAQSNLYQIPEPLRTECLESFLASRNGDQSEPRNYRDWLHQAFGQVFGDTFPSAYTRKYWTTEPRNMDVDWIGNRVLKPDLDEVIKGARGVSGRTTSHYLTDRESRYPSNGGFYAYTHRLAAGATIIPNARMIAVNFGQRRMVFAGGAQVAYQRLVSTIPLSRLIEASEDAPDSVREAARLLTCTEFLRIDVAVNHPARREDTWIYVYDEDKLSTRISLIEHFSPHNAPEGKSGIQVEVYGSSYRPLPAAHEQVAQRVVDELIELGLIDGREWVRSVHTKHVPQGNPIFDLNRRGAIADITRFLEHVGVLLVGRYGEWKYLMTDACIINGRKAASELLNLRSDVDVRGAALSSAG